MKNRHALLLSLLAFALAASPAAVAQDKPPSPADERARLVAAAHLGHLMHGSTTSWERVAPIMPPSPGRMASPPGASRAAGQGYGFLDAGPSSIEGVRHVSGSAWTPAL